VQFPSDGNNGLRKRRREGKEGRKEGRKKERSGFAYAAFSVGVEK
jgi:hypothetical protein